MYSEYDKEVYFCWNAKRRRIRFTAVLIYILHQILPRTFHDGIVPVYSYEGKNESRLCRHFEARWMQRPRFLSFFPLATSLFASPLSRDICIAIHEFPMNIYMAKLYSTWGKGGMQQRRDCNGATTSSNRTPTIQALNVHTYCICT